MTNLPSDAELDRLICLFKREPSLEFSFKGEDIVAALQAAKELKTWKEAHALSIQNANEAWATVLRLRALIKRTQPEIHGREACHCDICTAFKALAQEVKEVV